MLKIKIFSRSGFNFARETPRCGSSSSKLLKMWKNRYSLEKYFGQVLGVSVFVCNGITVMWVGPNFTVINHKTVTSLAMTAEVSM